MLVDELDKLDTDEILLALLCDDHDNCDCDERELKLLTVLELKLLLELCELCDDHDSCDCDDVDDVDDDDNELTDDHDNCD